MKSIHDIKGGSFHAVVGDRAKKWCDVFSINYFGYDCVVVNMLNDPTILNLAGDIVVMLV